jgi:hypothetical protein
MRNKSSLIAPLTFLVVTLCELQAVGQPPVHAIEPDQLSNDYQPFPLRQTPVYAEVNLLLNPVYVAQFSSHFRLNGHPLNIPVAYRPKFYSTQPWQKAFSSVEEIQDQANSAYASIYLTFLENSAVPFLHHIRLVVGATHEKMQSDSAQVEYGYHDGGTEATFMLEKNVAYRLSNRQYQTTGIIFGINAQAGLFESVAKVRTVIHYNGYNIISNDTNQRWQWPSPRNGWGWIAGVNMEVGGVLCHDYFLCRHFTEHTCVGKGLFWFFRRFGISLASKIMISGLYSADGVFSNGAPGNRFRINNYSLFLAGPLINIKWVSLN